MDVQEGYILKKIMMFIVVTNVVASRLPERRPTETVTTRINIVRNGDSHKCKGPQSALFFLNDVIMDDVINVQSLISLCPLTLTRVSEKILDLSAHYYIIKSKDFLKSLGICKDFGN